MSEGREWLLGVAKVRAARVLALIELYVERNPQLDYILNAINDEMQAILEDKDID